ncbi:YraN family protein [Stackebrandtia nassauensis]|uniref:UPF0102 protein Snas_2193 n=1 Tax=Stackebrandtia nassauensis (strain DSM 44728 / CIP 108903 / NRRL B-16338 / NBRC 102104 / LLR-40K-21) TaxID=446470 RepID=D3Q218_STANL|nr:YraN family protein [Stackebrandtia nassauensis]ADD41885.1 protein of unknown function UPF0102 [Stackebrandtia nassauensis DSM 44728]
MPHDRRHLRLGCFGENLAVAHLRRDGMRVLQRNWRCEHGELDIIAIERGVTVFCEVKTRRSLRFGTPMQAIDEAKALRIRRLAASWHRRYRDKPPWAEWLGLPPRRRAPNGGRRGGSPERGRHGNDPAGGGRGDGSPQRSRPSSRAEPAAGLGAGAGWLRGGVALVGTVVAVLAWRRGGRWRRRFDVVGVVLGGDGTATIDHRRGVL